MMWPFVNNIGRFVELKQMRRIKLVDIENKYGVSYLSFVWIIESTYSKNVIYQ